MKIEQASEKLAELGHVTRLSIYRLLVRAGTDGLAVSDLQQALVIPGSTLSHHIARLIKVGLLKQVRNGRILQCYAQYDELTSLISFLSDECCQDENKL